MPEVKVGRWGEKTPGPLCLTRRKVPAGP